jgi:hypothetical protein
VLGHAQQCCCASAWLRALPRPQDLQWHESYRVPDRSREGLDRSPTRRAVWRLGWIGSAQIGTGERRRDQGRVDNASCPQVHETCRDRGQCCAPLRASEISPHHWVDGFSTGGAGEKSGSEMPGSMRFQPALGAGCLALLFSSCRVAPGRRCRACRGARRWRCRRTDPGAVRSSSPRCRGRRASTPRVAAGSRPLRAA